MTNAHVNIHWKGTDTCLDLICSCGEFGHYDGYGADYVKCPACSRAYKLVTEAVQVPSDNHYYVTMYRPEDSDDNP